MKRRATDTAEEAKKKKRSNQRGSPAPREQPKIPQVKDRVSVRKQAEPYRLITAKFPINGLTPI